MIIQIGCEAYDLKGTAGTLGPASYVLAEALENAAKTHDAILIPILVEQIDEASKIAWRGLRRGLGRRPESEV